MTRKLKTLVVDVLADSKTCGECGYQELEDAFGEPFCLLWNERLHFEDDDEDRDTLRRPVCLEAEARGAALREEPGK